MQTSFPAGEAQLGSFHKAVDQQPYQNAQVCICVSEQHTWAVRSGMAQEAGDKQEITTAKKHLKCCLQIVQGILYTAPNVAKQHGSLEQPQAAFLSQGTTFTATFGLSMCSMWNQAVLLWKRLISQWEFGNKKPLPSFIFIENLSWIQCHCSGTAGKHGRASSARNPLLKWIHFASGWPWEKVT